MANLCLSADVIPTLLQHKFLQAFLHNLSVSDPIRRLHSARAISFLARTQLALPELQTTDCVFLIKSQFLEEKEEAVRSAMVYAFEQLCFHESLRRSFLADEPSVVPRLIEMGSESNELEFIQTLKLLALLSQSESEEESKSIFCDELIVTCLKHLNDGSSKYIRYLSAVIVANVSVGEEHIKVIITEPIPAAIIKCMHDFSSDDQLCFACITAVQKLSVVPLAAQSFVELNFIDEMTKVFQTSVDTNSLEACLQVMEVFLRHPQTSAMASAHAAFVHAVKVRMREDAISDRVKSKALQLFSRVDSRFVVSSTRHTNAP